MARIRGQRRLCAVVLTCLVPASQGRAEPHWSDAPLARCAALKQSAPRLRCFDALVPQQSGAPAKASSVATAAVPPFVHQLADFERSRPLGDHRFRMLDADQYAGQRKVLISAPALNQMAPRSLLTISCIDNISRLQLVVHPALPQHQARIGISVDGELVVPPQSWQILGNGVLVDAGRGLSAIEMIRRLDGATELELSSNLAQINGLRFSAVGLSPMISVQRHACRW